MRRTKSWIVGIACGALCAVCVFMYLQDAGAQVDAARAEALEIASGRRFARSYRADDKNGIHQVETTKTSSIGVRVSVGNA